MFHQLLVVCFLVAATSSVSTGYRQHNHVITLRSRVTPWHPIPKRSPARQPRDVPVSSYTRFGESPGYVVNLPDESEPIEPSEVKSQEYFKHDGSFGFGHNLPNGISIETKGFQKTVNKGQGQTMEGQYSYTSPEGVPIVTKWFADETGFHVQGPKISIPIFGFGR